MKIDKQTATVIQNDMAAALQAVAEKHGVKIIKAGGSVEDGIRAVLKFEVSDPSTLPGGSIEAADFLKHGPVLGFKAEDLNREITINGGRYRVIGLLPSRQKSVLILRLKDNKRRVIGPDFVRGLLREAAAK